MVIGKIKVSGTTATVDWSTEIPKGLVGGKVQIEYADERWKDLNKTVVFRGAVTRDVLDNGSEVIIPAEVLSRSGTNLFVGVYGTDAESDLGIPTFWAKLGVIRDAADPEDDPASDPSLPVWARLLERTPDWQAEPGSDNHILNRTHWFGVEAVDHTFNGDMTGKTVITAQDGYNFVKVSDAVLTVEDLIGATVTVCEGDEEATMEIPEDAIQDLNSEGFPAISVDEFIMCVQRAFSAYGMTFEAGVYFLCVVEDGQPVGYIKHLSAIPTEQEVVHKLDNKYLDAEWVANRVNGSEVVLAEATQEFYSSGSCGQTFQFALEPRENYAVTWDGERHICTCNQVAIDNFILPYLGNLHFFNEEYPDTGEPFCVLNVAILYLNLGTMLFARPTGDDVTHTVSIVREGNIRDRIPFEYLPNSYTFPSDLYYNGVDKDQLLTASLHLQKGGTVYAFYQNDIYRVLSIYVDLFDGWYSSLVMVGDGSIRIWTGQKGWFGYEPYKFSLCTPSYDEIYKYGKKFEITINENGELQTRDITGFTTN